MHILSMASANNMLLIICFTFIFSPCISAVSDSKGFSTNLIHIHSPSSPYKNVKADSLSRDTAVKSALSRHAYIRARQQKALRPTDFVPPPTIVDRIMFLANLSIGHPPTSVYAIMDTGSDLFWVQCEPCDVCYKQRDPIYDRSKSDSYIEMSCDASLCKSLGSDAECSNEDRRICLYSYAYEDGARTTGILSFENVVFTSHYTYLDRTTQVGFGCGLQNFNNLKGYRDGGVLGLGPGELSLVSQLNATAKASKSFAFCFGNLSDPNAQGFLVFGDPLYLNGDMTPLVIDEFYYIKLLSIGFGIVEPRFDINASLFERKPDGSGGVIFDTGTTMTVFVPEVYEVVKKAVVDKLREGYNIRPLRRDPDCFKGTIGRDLKFFPNMVLSLENAGLVIDKWGIFQKGGYNLFCLGFSGADGVNIIGNVFQQFYKFGFNLELNTLSIQPMPDCK